MPIKSSFIFFNAVLTFLCLSYALQAQDKLSVDEAVQSAIVNHPAIKAADYQVEQQRQLQGSTLNIPNPEFEYEKEKNSPYGLGVTQSFSLPGVYRAQSRLQSERTRLAESQKNISINELRRSIRQYYIQAQYLEALVVEYGAQDSTYQRFANAAKRQFDAGQIDFLQKTFAEAKASEIHNLYQKTLIDYQYSLETLRISIGFAEKPDLEYIYKHPAGNLTDTVTNPTIAYYSQSAQVELLNLKLQQSKILPDFFVGYQKNSPFNNNAFNRFRAGVSVPLWFGQYKSNIRSANAGVKAAEQLQLAQKVILNAGFQQATGSVNSNLQQVEFYEKTGLLQAKTIVTTASRLFTSGQNDYVSFIRNLADAYAIRLRYLEALKDYNIAVANLNALIGK
ncbi:MAG TPA: TolC family protein [Sphingobacteriaceae bacterium]|nr:TolC family protein [Sphingobacteriaceae bacterium]